MSGESFPYRKNFSLEQIQPQNRFSRGLICMKFDSEDVGGSAAESIYVPLRFVSDVVGDFAQDSRLLYFTYILGPTVDYRDMGMDHYSSGIRAAVLRALGERNLQHADDDRSLVIQVDLSKSLLSMELPGESETDRWISVARMLATGDNYRRLIQQAETHSRYSRTLYTRISKIQRVGGKKPFQPASTNGRYQFVLPAGSNVNLEVLTNIDPKLPQEFVLDYKLSFNTHFLDVVDDRVDVSKGTLRHEFQFRCRRPTSHTQVKLSASGKNSPVTFLDVVVPLKISNTVRTRLNVWGPLMLFFLGIFLAMLGVLGNPVTDFLVGNFGGEIRELFKFLAIVLSSAAGLWAYIVEQRT